MPLIADSLRNASSAAIVAALMIAALVLGRDILLPFALAVVLAFILAPSVRRLTHLGAPRSVAAGSVMILVIIAFLAASAAFSAQLLSLTADLSKHKENIIQKVRTFTGATSSNGILKRASDSVDAISKEFEKELRKPSNPAQPGTAPVVVARDEAGSEPLGFKQLAAALGPLAFAGLTILFTLFLLVQYQDLRDRVVRLAGTDNMSLTTAALGEAGGRLSDLFTIQAALNAAFGFVVAVVLAIIGVPSAILWGIATALLRFVPFIGSLLAAIPPVLLAASIDPGWGTTIATIALFVIGEPIMGHVIEPMLLGRRAGLSPIAFVAAVSFWTLVWGPAGLVLAAPLTMSLVVLGQYIPRFEFLTILLGDIPALAPDQEFYHRLLAGDAALAFDDFTTAAETDPIAVVGDRLVLPALHLAARDHRAGRLSEPQVAQLRETVRDFIDMLRASSAVRDDPKGNVIDNEQRPAVVLPVRGIADELAAQFVTFVLSEETSRNVVAIEKASGLMGLSSATSAVDSASPAEILLISISDGVQSYAQLIARRAVTMFPDASVLTCEFGAGYLRGEASLRRAGDGARVCATLLEALTLIAANRNPSAAQDLPRGTQGFISPAHVPEQPAA